MAIGSLMDGAALECGSVRCVGLAAQCEEQIEPVETIMTTAMPSLSRSMSWSLGRIAGRQGDHSRNASTTTARDIIVALTPAVWASNRWVPFFSRPAEARAPSTIRMLPIIEPAMLALTTSVKPSRKAMIVMISSAAFPSVALSRAPIFAPV